MVIFFNPPRLLSINSSLLSSNNCGTKGSCAYRSRGASHSAIAQQHFCTGGKQQSTRTKWLASLCKTLLWGSPSVPFSKGFPFKHWQLGAGKGKLCTPLCVHFLGDREGGAACSQSRGRSEHLPRAGRGEEIPSSSRSIVHFYRQIPPALHN